MLSLEVSSSHTPWFARPIPPRRGAAAIFSSHEEEASFYPSKKEEKELRKTKFFDERLPNDPRTWNREDVQNWIKQISSVHGLPSIEADRFLMNGKALCLMTMDMFCQRVPLGGKMLYKDFQLRLCNAMYSSSS
ncbi:EDL [Lepeophtheirus salmonis]|uniref:EDL n=1 Tax=Lepeophtheirus salmonis TaxID=72036 RepID=A0A0K2TQ24_LEPSM|nr:protein C-ets-1-like [Lepeophtheirus salmonis]CAB4059552.1 EDL [Lepeophtheirus salmonis]CAF2850489.1 EDL [Lepeophtheirus salmonis]